MNKDNLLKSIVFWFVISTFLILSVVFSVRSLIKDKGVVRIIGSLILLAISVVPMSGYVIPGIYLGIKYLTTGQLPR